MLSGEENPGDTSGKLEEEYGGEAQSILMSGLRVSQGHSQTILGGPELGTPLGRGLRTFLGLRHGAPLGSGLGAPIGTGLRASLS